ncbi:hypothetical protein RHECNPAF_750097 [Rhizobium etli CNPAF512]|nr:hypothetical protein RHECNPAF_750097 [Rhizobium etli CNPAF512]
MRPRAKYRRAPACCRRISKPCAAPPVHRSSAALPGRLPGHDEALDHQRHSEEAECQHGADGNGGEDKIRPEIVLGVEDIDAEAARGSRIFGKDRADDGIGDRDSEAGEEIGQRRGKPGQAENAPAACLHRVQEFSDVAVGRLITLQQGDEQREEGDQRYQQYLRQQAETEPENDEGRDRHQRQGLAANEDRQQCPAHEGHEIHQDRRDESEGERQGEAAERGAERRPGVGYQRFAVQPALGKDAPRCRQDGWFDAGKIDIEFPCGQKGKPGEQGGARPVQGATERGKARIRWWWRCHQRRFQAFVRLHASNRKRSKDKIMQQSKMPQPSLRACKVARRHRGTKLKRPDIGKGDTCAPENI